MDICGASIDRRWVDFIIEYWIESSDNFHLNWKIVCRAKGIFFFSTNDVTLNIYLFHGLHVSKYQKGNAFDEPDDVCKM